MKRFYKDVAVTESAGGFAIMLDGRAIRTQGGKAQVLPSAALAERMAQEWREQGETIDPTAFAFRDMADYALDMLADNSEAAADKLLRFAETDTLCYRADPDEPLWHRQRDLWEPLVSALEAREDIKLERISGIMHRPLAARTLDRLRARVRSFDPFTLAALEQLASLAASLTIGLAALEKDAEGEALWDAANLEEDWQVEQWGADDEAAARRARRKADFLNAIEFARLASR